MASPLERQATAAKASPALFAQLEKSLAADGADLQKKLKALVVFKIDDDLWTLDLRVDSTPAIYQGAPKGDDKADLTLTVTDDNFTKLVMGKLNPQQAFLMRKLKINGSMGIAMKLQPVLEAAQPKAKL